ncbi:hypothetical protein [Pyruvatibacter sp.]
MKVYRDIHDEFYLTTQVDLTTEGLTVSVWEAEDDKMIGEETETWPSILEDIIEDVEDRVEDHEITKLAGKLELEALAKTFQKLAEELTANAQEL